MVSVREIEIIIPSNEDVECNTNAYDQIMNRKFSSNLDSEFSTVKLGSKLPRFAACKQFEDLNLPTKLFEIMNEDCKYAVLCGLLILERANLISRESEEPWVLPLHLRDRVGVMYTSSYAHHEQAMRNAEAHAHVNSDLIKEICDAVSDDDRDTIATIISRFQQQRPQRKVALQLSLQANVQLAQIIKARGPNTFCSNACASTTAAIKFACNEIRLDEADMMVVISSDCVLGSGNQSLVESFASLRAATTSAKVEQAIQPFGKQPTGFVFGEAAIGVLLAKEDAVSN